VSLNKPFSLWSNSHTFILETKGIVIRALVLLKLDESDEIVEGPFA
jgi:hypothetical protein